MMALFLYHWFPITAEELSVTELPWQNVVLPELLMAGAAGIALKVTSMGFEKADVQLPEIMLTV